MANQFRRNAIGRVTALLVLAGCAGVGVLAQAQGSTQATLTLRASMPQSCTVALSTTSATLDLNAGVTNLPVATVEERCNASNGYTVSMVSKNGGALSAGGANIGYTLHYGDTNSSTGTLAAERGVSGNARQTVLSVSIPPGTNRQAGDYEDTVTISIAAK
ncbi:hypothetical protein [Niveispirillum fermenti]|uniref:hypothetical protein n=1 Tax=Niveispirillum fermenti TaxID=1233113 RepID=UPI003A89129A